MNYHLFGTVATRHVSNISHFTFSATKLRFKRNAMKIIRVFSIDAHTFIYNWLLLLTIYTKHNTNILFKNEKKKNRFITTIFRIVKQNSLCHTDNR